MVCVCSLVTEMVCVCSLVTEMVCGLFTSNWNGLWSVQSKAHQLAKQEKIAARKKMREEEEAEEEATRKKLAETHRRVSVSFHSCAPFRFYHMCWNI